MDVVGDGEDVARTEVGDFLVAGLDGFNGFRGTPAVARTVTRQSMNGSSWNWRIKRTRDPKERDLDHVDQRLEEQGRCIRRRLCWGKTKAMQDKKSRTRSDKCRDDTSNLGQSIW